jgi:hypothetical protein
MVDCLGGVFMSQEQDTGKKPSTESFADIFRAFGLTISEIINDPELKEKAREFTESAAELAKAFRSRLKDEDVRGKYRDIGKAAEDFGKGIANRFKKDKQK